MSQPVDVYSFNPKALTKSRLFGMLDLDTREWTDGVLTHASRKAVADSSKMAWIICDGDVDPEWIEALNRFDTIKQQIRTHYIFSVLDDNKLLTLPNGD